MLNKKRVWFGDLKSPLILTLAESRLLVKFVAVALGIGKEKVNLESNLQNDKEPRIVFLSFGNPKTEAKVVMGEGMGIVEAIDDATSLIRQSPLIELKKLSIFKLDLVQIVKTLENFHPQNSLSFPKNLYGLAFPQETGLAFLPEEILSHTLVGKKNQLRQPNLLKYLKKRGISPSFPQKLPLTGSQTLYQFQSTSLFSDGQVMIPLYGGRGIFGEKISKENLLQAAILGGRYLTNAVDAYGKFIYSYQPKTDKVTNEYNILRHAGTIYAMLELYEITRESELLEATKRAISYMVETFFCPYPLEIKPLSTLAINQQPLTCVVEDGYAKLGGNALAILALAKYTEVCKDSQYLPDITALGRWIQAVQRPNGSFGVHKQSYPDGKVSSFECRFYPGEAILAMTRLYPLDKNESWLDTASDAANDLINERDGNLPIEKLPHDHWLLYGLNELYRYRPQKIYLERTQQIASAIIESQNQASVIPLERGSFNQPPTSTTATATRSEGLLAAYELVKDYGEEELAQRILAAVRLAISFQLQAQFRRESAMYLPSPPRAVGGFHRHQLNFEVRIDYVQHNLSSILGLLKIESGLEHAS
jgi:hypothetical protein